MNPMRRSKRNLLAKAKRRDKAEQRRRRAILRALCPPVPPPATMPVDQTQITMSLATWRHITSDYPALAEAVRLKRSRGIL